MEQGGPCLPKGVWDDLEQLAAFFRVLAEPNRLCILYLLMQQERCVCELLPDVGISQPLLSHHLGVLTTAGLIRPRRQAQRIFYSIAPEALTHFKGLFLAYYDPANLPPEAAMGRGVDCPMAEATAQPAE